MLSIANIPFKFINFKGIISALIIDNKEFSFTTYNNTKIIKYEVGNDSLNIILKKGAYNLEIISTFNEGHKLSAPVKQQQMSKAKLVHQIRFIFIRNYLCIGTVLVDYVIYIGIAAVYEFFK